MPVSKKGNIRSSFFGICKLEISFNSLRIIEIITGIIPVAIKTEIKVKKALFLSSEVEKVLKPGILPQK